MRGNSSSGANSIREDGIHCSGADPSCRYALDLLLLRDNDSLSKTPQNGVATVDQFNFGHVDRALMIRDHHRCKIAIRIARRLLRLSMHTRPSHIREMPRCRAVLSGHTRRVPYVFRTNASRIRSGVKGWWRILAPSGFKASFTATHTEPIAPIRPPSPIPLAPSLVDASGVSTWSSTMSGISAAIGTR